MISFQANLISRPFIKQKLMLDFYGDCQSSFVEFNSNSIRDVKAVRDAAKSWRKMNDNNKTFADDIYDELFEVFEAENKEYYPRRFFGLTTQKDSFEKMDSDKIIGLAEVSHIPPDRFDESDVTLIDLLQTIPNSMYLKAGRKFKKIGQTLRDLLISMFDSKPIVIVPTKASKDFYLGTGFKTVDNMDYMMLKK